jgi:hypothetical protein
MGTAVEQPAFGCSFVRPPVGRPGFLREKLWMTDNFLQQTAKTARICQCVCGTRPRDLCFFMDASRLRRVVDPMRLYSTIACKNGRGLVAKVRTVAFHEVEVIAASW